MVLRVLIVITITAICPNMADDPSISPMSKAERKELREEARSMFYHAFTAYMDNAYPADELMPLSCKGRFKGVTPSRGDMDDALGNFSLTLVDSLDTLVILGDFEGFNEALKLVIKDVSFDQDIVVSVFETNIRMLGGLLSAHVLATTLKHEISILEWYKDQLLVMAHDLGKRLLPAFNTSTGIPHGKINLRYGLKGLSDSRETCTACAGTMILEMAALSRLTGDPIFEQKAHKAMDRLWKIRHRTSDLMGTVINIHSGDWVRKDSGVGAGIDSYYEYCLKAYVLLGDEKYLARFNRHYNAIMKYISRGPVLLDVHMHRPHLQSRNFMDALLAFWPGLQVMLGDVKPAVETHEMLYQVMQKHTFIPEAFTSDFQVHWGQHPLRPEFLESTYFLHQATGDDHYLQVGKAVLKALQKHARVPCGYAAVNDVRTRIHEDRMDSFVLAETFKYLFMLFSYDAELPIKTNDYILTTEAHFLPLNLAGVNDNTTYLFADHENEDRYVKTCPNTASIFPEDLRKPLRQLIGDASSRSRPVPKMFTPSDRRQLIALADMGISVLTQTDGRVQLLYTTSTAKSAKDAEEGLIFMREMTKWTELNEVDNGIKPAGILVNSRILPAGPGHFGAELTGEVRVSGVPLRARPQDACARLENAREIRGRVGVAVRGQCTFAAKARALARAGATAAVIVDNADASSSAHTPMFAMSGDGQHDIHIPVVFLFSDDARYLEEAMRLDPNVRLTLGDLHFMKRNLEHGGCADAGGACERASSTEESLELVASAEADSSRQDSFNQLKQVLGQLVAQLETSLASDETSAPVIAAAAPPPPVVALPPSLQPAELDATDTAT